MIICKSQKCFSNILSTSLISFFNNIQILFGLLFLAICLILPSGSIYGVNVKMYVSITCIFIILYKSIITMKYYSSDLTYIVIVLLFFFLSTLISLVHGTALSSIFSQMTAICATLLPILVGISLLRINGAFYNNLLNFWLFSRICG